MAEPRMETEEAQDAQMILGDPLQRVADEAHAPGLQVGQTAEIIEQFAGRGIGIERVHREIAPRRVLAPVVGKGDDGMAAIGRHVAAQRRNLDRPVGQDDRDRAMRDAGRHRLESTGAHPVDHRLGRQRRRQVDIGDGQAQQHVAHRAADETTLQPLGKSDQLGAVGPGRGAGRHAVHCIRRDRLTIIAAVAPQMRRSFHNIS